MKLLLTGSAGQLGAAMAREFGRDCEVLAPRHAELDITCHRDVMERVRRWRPEVVINCAGYNDVDGSQDDAVTALAVNAFAVQSLARAASEAGAIFVHYSTDFVFNGSTDRPYTEEDAPNPRSFYSISKLVGEWFAREVPRHYLMRVESLFGGCVLGSTHKSSVDRITDAILENRDVVVFSDRTVSPSFVPDVAAATRRLIETRAAFGLYHCVNSGHTTWLGLAREIGACAQVEPRLTARKMSEMNLRVDRPQFAALSSARLASAGVSMPSWQDAIGRYVALRTVSGFTDT